MEGQDGLMGVTTTRGMSQCHAQVTGCERDRGRQEAVNMDAKGQKEKAQLVNFLMGINMKFAKQEF